MLFSAIHSNYSFKAKFWIRLLSTVLVGDEFSNVTEYWQLGSVEDGVHWMNLISVISVLLSQEELGINS